MQRRPLREANDADEQQVSQQAQRFERELDRAVDHSIASLVDKIEREIGKEFEVQRDRDA